MVDNEVLELKGQITSETLEEMTNGKEDDEDE